MADLLATIVACARSVVETRREREPLGELASRAERAEPRGAAFRAALARPGRVNVIAECKRRSPAKGVLRSDYHPGSLARAYEEGGAAAVSVLTEPTFFDGALAHLEEVRAAVGLPILRKDFVIDEYQLFEARAAGADAVLLIAAALDGDRLSALHRRAQDLGLAALVEVHTGDELSRAVDAGASIIGVNSRNLSTLDVNLGVCDTLAERIPASCVGVAESGVRTPADLRRLAERGYRAFLIGEWLATSPDPAAVLRGITGQDAAPAGARPL